jgi:hypothetical protein
MSRNYRDYSAVSVNLSRFPACFGALRSTIPHESFEITLVSKPPYGQDKPTPDDLRTLSKSKFPVMFTFKQGSTSHTVRFSYQDTVFWVGIGRREYGEIVDLTEHEPEIDKLHQLVGDSLNVSKATAEDWRGVSTLPNMNNTLWKIHDTVASLKDKQDNLSSRVDILLTNLAPKQVQEQQALSAFLSFRFDDHSKALALELREMLELSDVHVVTGLGYEPRAVSDKVLERLTGPLDLFIILHSSSGDSAWLNQEIGVAKGRNLPILVLREEDTASDVGMLGDTEYITFPTNAISKSFVGILQALRYLRSAK